MAFELEVVTDFMYSGYLPERCVFSGRTDAIEKTSYNLRRAKSDPLWMSPLFPLMVLGLLTQMFYVVQVSEQAMVPIYINPGGRFRWRILRFGGILPLVLAWFPLVILIAVILQPEVRTGTNVLIAAIEALLLIGGLAWLVLGYKNTTSIRSTGEHTLLLKFPAAMESTYEAFKTAYAEFRIPYEEGQRRAKAFRNPKLNYTSAAAKTAAANASPPEPFAADQTEEPEFADSQSDDPESDDPASEAPEPDDLTAPATPAPAPTHDDLEPPPNH